jgi:hypothetical protein
MSNQNKNNIKETLRNYSPEVDNTALWAALEEHVPAPNKKRRFLPIWFWFGGVSLIVITLGIWNFNDNDVSNNNSIKERKVFIEADQTGQSQDVVLENNEIIAQKNTSKSSTVQAVKKSVTTKSLNKTNYKDDNTKEVINSSVTDQLDQLNFTSDKSGLNTSILRNSLGEEKVKEETNSKVVPVEILVDNIKEGDEATSPTMIIEANRSLVDLESIDKRVLQILNFGNYILTDLIAPVNKSNQYRLWLQVGAGSGQTFQNIIVDEDSPYIGLSNQYKMMPSLSFSGLIGYDIFPRLALFSGIKYNRITTRLSSQVNDVTYSYESGITSTTIDENGNTIEIEGPIETSSERSYSGRWHTYHQYFSVPVGIQFGLIKSRKFDVNANAGMNFNLFNVQNGAVINELSELNKFEHRTSPYSTELISPFGGIGIQYKLLNGALGLQSELSYQNNRYSISGQNIKETFISNNFIITYTHYIK